MAFPFRNVAVSIGLVPIVYVNVGCIPSVQSLLGIKKYPGSILGIVCLKIPTGKVKHVINTHELVSEILGLSACPVAGLRLDICHFLLLRRTKHNTGNHSSFLFARYISGLNSRYVELRYG